MINLDTLKDLHPLAMGNGRPQFGLTDKKWQQEFAIRKLYIKPYPKKIKKLGGRHSQDVKTWNIERDGEYMGMTDHQQFCRFINDVLSVIRSGGVDFTYFKYQNMELAKFHYDDLRTKYCDGYWEVWLENSKGEY